MARRLASSQNISFGSRLGEIFNLLLASNCSLVKRWPNERHLGCSTQLLVESLRAAGERQYGSMVQAASAPAVFISHRTGPSSMRRTTGAQPDESAGRYYSPSQLLLQLCRTYRRCPAEVYRITCLMPMDIRSSGLAIGAQHQSKPSFGDIAAPREIFLIFWPHKALGRAALQRPQH